MKTKPNTKKGDEVEFTSSFFPGQKFLVKPKNIHPVPPLPKKFKSYKVDLITFIKNKNKIKNSK